MTFSEKFVSGLCLLFCLIIGTAVALNEKSRVVDGAGARQSNTVFQSVSAVGEFSSAVFATNAFNINHGGFLNTFVMHPQLDTDDDGIANENDPDNDGDRLADSDELSGTAFSPKTATSPDNPDTDDDGVKDGDEAAAGTNPEDSDSRLQITDVKQSPNGDPVIFWQGRSGATYEIIAAAGADQLATNFVVVGETAAGGGSPPWYETTVVFTNTSILRKRLFYRVRLKP